MRRLAILPILLLAFCTSGNGGTGVRKPPDLPPGQGAITIEIVPNPIVATKISGDTYEFPFEVVVRETGGQPVTIERVSADVLALGTIRVAQESYDAARIRALGYDLSVPANGTLRYTFRPRKEVDDDRLFGGVSAEVRADGRDASGNIVTARTSVTIRR
jgi:hypothetical protein